MALWLELTSSISIRATTFTFGQIPLREILNLLIPPVMGEIVSLQFFYKDSIFIK